MKAWVFIVQTCHEVRQTEQDSVDSKIAGNIESSIKSQKFAQRFAVFSASQLHANNEYQFSKSGYVPRVTWHSATHLEQSKHKDLSQKHTTKRGKAITRRVVHLCPTFTRLLVLKTVTASFLEYFRLRTDRKQRLSSDLVAQSVATFGCKCSHTDATATTTGSWKGAVRECTPHAVCPKRCYTAEPFVQCWMVDQAGRVPSTPLY